MRDWRGSKDQSIFWRHELGVKEVGGGGGLGDDGEAPDAMPPYFMPRLTLVEIII